MMKTCQKNIEILLFNRSMPHLKHVTIDALSFLHECNEDLLMKLFVHNLQYLVQPDIEIIKWIKDTEEFT